MSYIEKYQLWKNQKNLDPELKKELDQLSEEAIKEVFFSDLSFGTGGLRGILGVGTNRVNRYTIRKATLGFANYLKKNNLLQGVAISYDNRHMSKTFAKEAAMVLAAEGIPSYLFRSMRPTPMLSFAVRHFNASGGIMITASHNPKEYNGYKVYDQSGAQVTLDAAISITEEIQAIADPFQIKTLDNSLIQTIDETFDNIYLDLVKKITIHPQEPSIKIVYSPLHGTGGTVIPRLLKEEGYAIYPYEPQMTPDPNFSMTASSNPEEPSAYIKTIKYAQTIGADLIMVTDPDADRLGIAVLHQGSYHLLSGNQTAALELFYILSERKKKGQLPKDGMVYKTIVTTDLIDKIASDFGVTSYSTLTGFKFIGEQAEKNKHHTTYLFGCEESYGSLIQDFVRDKDAVQACYLLAELTNFYRNQQMTLIDVLNQIYQTYGHFYEYTKSITLPGLSGLEKIHTLMEHFRNHPPHIKNKKLVSYDDYEKGIKVENNNTFALDLPKSSVLKYYYEDNTWIVFRPSGTEPKIKIYFQTVSKNMEDAITFVDQLVDELMNEIRGI
ncbi:MAG: phospho-sugar mutase [Acholeplasmataceae bacterium]|nr:phospho-sugar mutase [Acholeplasmataceae bacterium]